MVKKVILITEDLLFHSIIQLQQKVPTYISTDQNKAGATSALRNFYYYWSFNFDIMAKEHYSLWFLHLCFHKLINAVFRLERATEVLELTYLGKYFACVNAN